MMQRFLLDFTDTGTQVLTAGPVFGQIMQYRYCTVAGDTGGSLEIGLYPRESDTGDGFLFGNHTNPTPNYTKAPRQPMTGLDGAPDPADTGAAFGVCVVAAGDRIRARKLGASGTARLYVWTAD